MLSTDIQVLRDKRINPPPETAIFIAADNQGIALGFIHLQTGEDYYHETSGYIVDLIVAPEGEGRGISRVLNEENRGRRPRFSHVLRVHPAQRGVLCWY